MTTYRSKEKTRDMAELQTRHREIKALNYPEKSDLIMELGAGHLNDLRTWVSRGIKTIIAIEMDGESLERGKLSHEKFGGPNIIPVHADLTTDTEKIMKELWKYKGKVEHVIANFCIHFFLGSDTIFGNVCELVKFFIKPGGTFRITTLDGAMVYQDLHNLVVPREKTAGGYYARTIEISDHKFRDIINVRELPTNTIRLSHDGKDFIKIQRLYHENEEFKKYGQMINVYVRSIGKYHNEYLVNFDDYVTPKLEEYGFIRMIKKHFPDYKNVRETSMNGAEKKYSSYHVFAEFRFTGSEDTGSDNTRFVPII